MSINGAEAGALAAPENGTTPFQLAPAWTRDSVAIPFSRQRLALAKRGFTTRRVPFESFFKVPRTPWLISGAARPRAGDVVLARVERIGQHARIELPDGRRARLHVGDEILVAYGDRYAPDQFEAEVPLDLGPTNLVASGGVASTVLSRSATVGRATEILPIGLVTDDMRTPVNLNRFGVEPVEPVVPRPRSLAVVGTSMNSGKTTTVQSLVLGLRAAGEVVGATKVTGTGSGVDYWVMVDAGASCVADFTDFGLVSTYRVPFSVVEANFAFLVNHLANAGCTAILIEVADGVYQQETARLLTSEVFRSCVDGVIFAAADAAGAVGGTRHLIDLALPVVAASGTLTRSPLVHREASKACSVPVFTRSELADATTAKQLFMGTYAHSADEPRVEPSANYRQWIDGVLRLAEPFKSDWDAAELVGDDVGEYGSDPVGEEPA